jgi:uncharacterized membrane protein YoaK (UPF0700 family)
LLVGALLTFVGGFLDAYTFVGHAVFANAQTGNVVLFGVETASRHWHAALLRLIPIAAFVVDRCGWCSSRKSSFWRP